jgi:hypothetical protein
LTGTICALHLVPDYFVGFVLIVPYNATRLILVFLKTALITKHKEEMIGLAGLVN